MLREVLQICKEFNVQQLWYGDIKVRFGDDGPLPVLDPMSATKKIINGQPDLDKHMPSNDELLGWSTDIELVPQDKQ